MRSVLTPTTARSTKAATSEHDARQPRAQGAVRPAAAAAGCRPRPSRGLLVGPRILGGLRCGGVRAEIRAARGSRSRRRGALDRAAAPPTERAARGTSAPRSASTSTAGRTTSTPSSATARSITVTNPKSRSIRMSETTSTAKPAIAVTPEASTAAPVERYVRRSASSGVVAGGALGAVALTEQDAELGRDRDHERPEHDRHRVQRDPREEQDERRPAGRQRDRDERDQRAARAAERGQQHEADREQPGQQRQRCVATARRSARWPRPRAPAGRRAARSPRQAGRARGASFAAPRTGARAASGAGRTRASRCAGPA